MSKPAAESQISKKNPYKMLRSFDVFYYWYTGIPQ